MPQANPDAPSFEREAADLLAAFHAAADTAIDRVHRQLPPVKFGARADAAAFPLALPEARTVIARENGAQSWGELLLNIKLKNSNYGEALEQFKALVYAGDAAALDALLAAQPALRSTLDDPHFWFGSTALIIAKENLALVDALLKHGADINAKSQWWAGDFHILEGASAAAAAALIERGARVNAHAAAEQGWLDWLEAAYRADAAIVSRRGGDGKTPLHYAREPAVIDWLLARGADMEARDLDHASTPLQWQLGARDFETARALVERGAQVDIFAAVMLGDLSLVQAALRQRPGALGARINASGYDLAPRADGSHQYVYAFNAAGLSPHQAALECSQEEIFRFLVAQSPPALQLLALCAAGDAAARRIAEAHPGLVASLDERDQRQLIHAAWTGNAASLRLMTGLGFDLHIRDDDAMTPLHAAAFHGFADCIAILLAGDNAPPLTWLNRYGGTPLTTCMYGREHSWRKDGDFYASMELLVAAGSEVRAEWLPSGDAALDAILRAGISAGGD